jgi:hypothetical protein
VPRAPAARDVPVAGDAPPAYLARLAERAASARAAAFHLWGFEDDAHPGRFVEFIETRDSAALATALLHDELLGESLDFRHAPPGGVSGAPAPAWERFTGVADS